MSHAPPLFVDLDGTLIRTDLLVESWIALFKRKPWLALCAPFWLLRGKSHLKTRIAAHIVLAAEHLPYKRELLAYLRSQHASGRVLHLATASHRRYAEAVATHLGLFQQVLASDAVTNLSGSRKLAAIRAVAGDDFVYAGNDHVDLPIWNAARAAIVVETPAQASRLIQTPVEAEFARTGMAWPRALFKALRPHQWLKNVLVFLPLLPILTQASVAMGGAALLAFIAFSLCASSVYLVNDLSDLEADRAHPRKCRRPFAAGDLSCVVGLLLAPLLLLAALLPMAFLPSGFALVLGVYWLTTNAYTFVLKRYALIDVITLASLYTLRVIGGGMAIGVMPSFWMLAFSMFIFMSLALAKRYAELHAMQALQRDAAEGRGYQVLDLGLVQQMGVASGYMAVLVMALYINSGEIVARYGHAELLWLICPLLMLWISRIWLKAVRGEMSDDPLVFALRDRLSQIVLMLAAVLVLVALVWHS